ncbi:uncharacterized protein A4U43_C03F25540 [Asparagus officinalis]|uniref:protein-serine/threonine phosphatase n=1 Tax=Asparagus officinalis TaxID=4686 RepID=A0A5P1FDV5_ASPOF|nr:uncharacterized protein A4U43_C03F25540 [Asparagus officinalis]
MNLSHRTAWCLISAPALHPHLSEGCRPWIHLVGVGIVEEIRFLASSTRRHSDSDPLPEGFDESSAWSQKQSLKEPPSLLEGASRAACLKWAVSLRDSPSLPASCRSPPPRRSPLAPAPSAASSSQAPTPRSSPDPRRPSRPSPSQKRRDASDILDILKAEQALLDLRLSIALKAAITGLLEARRVNEWIVTEKLGDSHRTKPAAKHVVDIERENTSSKEKSNSFGFFGGRFGPGFASKQQGMSLDVIKSAYATTEEGFISIVKKQWSIMPQIASVCSCCLVGIICGGMLYIANAGDSCAVLGRWMRGERAISATEHNASIESVRC